MKLLCKAGMQALFLFIYLVSQNNSDCLGSELAKYAVQVMASSEKNTAQGLLKKLTKKGYDAYIHKAPGEFDSLPYKVRIGKFETKAEAKQQAASLSKVGITCWITDAEQEGHEEKSLATDSLNQPDTLLEQMDGSALPLNKTEPGKASEKTALPLKLSKKYKYYDP
ncbi:MAG: SPOR domain-containing protein, partial [Pseudomonadota bacterium]